VLIAAVCVMLFFILFVLPQFHPYSGLRSEIDSAAQHLHQAIGLPCANAVTVTFGAAWLVASLWWLLRRPGAAGTIMTAILPRSRHSLRLSVLSHQSVLPESRRPA